MDVGHKKGTQSCKRYEVLADAGPWRLDRALVFPDLPRYLIFRTIGPLPGDSFERQVE